MKRCWAIEITEKNLTPRFVVFPSFTRRQTVRAKLHHKLTYGACRVVRIEIRKV